MSHPITLCLLLHGDNLQQLEDFDNMFVSWFEEMFLYPPGDTTYRLAVDPKGYNQVFAALMIDAGASMEDGYYVSSWEVYCRRCGIAAGHSVERYFDYYTLWVL